MRLKGTDIVLGLLVLGQHTGLSRWVGACDGDGFFLDEVERWATQAAPMFASSFRFRRIFDHFQKTCRRNIVFPVSNVGIFLFHKMVMHLGDDDSGGSSGSS